MEFMIRAEHPALAGHFPGRPVVPAVVILDEVLAAVACLDPAPVVTGIAHAKFMSVLLPNQVCRISFVHSEKGVRFACESEGRAIASGLLTLA